MNERWCGGQHHFIGRCDFHLTTYVNGYLVSTVGEYFSELEGSKMRTLSVGEDSFYETMVFPLPAGTVIEPFEGECPELIDWSCVDSDLYATHQEAMRGHLLFVDKARNGEL